MGGGFGQYVEKMIIPEGVTTIPYYGLGWTPNLKSLVLPKTFSSVGGPAFYSCNNLTDIYYAGSQAMWNQIYIAPEMDDEVWFNATIHYNYIPEE